MRQTKLHVYPPERDVFRYTVFHKHVPDLLDQWQTKYAQIDLEQNFFITDGKPTDTLVEILAGDGQCYLIAGYTDDEDKKASLLKAAYDCVKSPHLPTSLRCYVPCQVDCRQEAAVDSRNLRTAARIHGYIEQTLNIPVERVKEILHYSPPILFFFDFSQIKREIKADFALALANFITTCQEEGYPQHKFVISDNNFSDGIGQTLISHLVDAALYEFQPRLDVILERDPERLQKALENIEDTQKGQRNIRQFLSPLKPKCLSWKQPYYLICGLHILVNSPDDRVRNRTRDLLTEIAQDDTFGERERHKAVEGICKVQIGETTAVIKTLLHCLEDEYVIVRCEAAKGLGKLGKRKLLGKFVEETLEALLKSLQSDDQYLLYAVLESLGQVAPLSPSMSMRNCVLKTLISHWRPGDSTPNKAVVSALGKLGVATRDAVKILETALQKGSSTEKPIGEKDFLVKKAEEAFNQLRTADEEGIEELVKASQSENREVQEYARRALCRIGYYESKQPSIVK